jgi:hypothetical protein
MNKRQKMYITNSLVRKWLEANGYKDLHFFPHNRFSKDVHFQDLSFDGCASLGTQFVLFQCKTNCKPTKKVIEQMAKAEKSSSVKLLWFNKVKGKTELEVY